jgi:Protein of unknown function (DUF2795)
VKLSGVSENPGSRKSKKKSKKELAMALADFIKVQKFLGGIRYPATKQQLVDQARGNQADDEALSALSGMPEREYSGPDEVSRAIPEG